VSQIPGLTAEVEAAAGLSLRKRECLELHLKGASYRWIARQLGLVAHTTAREHVTKAIFKIERVMRVDEPCGPRGITHSVGTALRSRKERDAGLSLARKDVCRSDLVSPSLGGAEVVSCRGKDEEECRCT
jgi:DNA-binding CsgD family transcriptional regulator